jgi:glycosyltransferase involved in cell wall biosynthesis
MGRTNDPDFWYQQASLFIMYSKFEGFPNALVEAMSYGLPVISSNCKTGPQDIVNHLENGLLVELSNNREPLKEAMKYMIDNQQEAKQMGERAIAVRELYKIEKVSLKWSDLFESK